MKNTRERLRRGVAELTLIFVGITAALAFENWSAERTERATELELLSALAEDVDETLLDLRRDFEASTDIQQRFEALLRFDPPVPAQVGGTRLGDDLSALFVDSRVFPQVSTYESMKSIGLDVVADPVLRSAISAYYELTLARVVVFETLLDEARNDFARPVILGHLTQQGLELREREAQFGIHRGVDYGLGLRDEETFAEDPEVRIVLRDLYNAEVVAIWPTRTPSTRARPLPSSSVTRWRASSTTRRGCASASPGSVSGRWVCLRD